MAESQIYPLRDLQWPSQPEPLVAQYKEGVPIAIDFGHSEMRIGLANSDHPSNRFPSLMSRFRDRRHNQTLTFVGNDVYLDASIRSNVKSPFDGPFVTNWETVEHMLDYTFEKLGVTSSRGVANPVVMSEIPGAPPGQRHNMQQLLFEAYSCPKVAFGVDSLFSFYANGGKSGIVLGTGTDATHVIPVLQGRALMSDAKRLDWGGNHAVNYMSEYLPLKYPYFPTRITPSQLDLLIKDHCYVSKDFASEIETYFDLDTLKQKDRTIEAPFNKIQKAVKTEEELQLELEKRKESGRRLQEQAQKARLEKLLEKEKQYELYLSLKEEIKSLNKKAAQQKLSAYQFEDEADFLKYLSGLEKSLKRARNQDLGEDENEGPPTFPLVDVADENLSPEELKEKRKQKLLKANYDARMRAKKEKELENERQEEEKEKDKIWRNSDLKGWIGARRQKLNSLIDKKKNREKLKSELSNRKSRAAQIRMKNIASLASDEKQKAPTRGKRAVASTIDSDPNDTFGANDDDWAIYRDIANVEDVELEEEENQQIITLEQDLLEFDPTFTIEDVYNDKFDWKSSVLHKFLRGAAPYDPEDQHQQHQIHLNVERIRVPEVYFQPSIAGVDQAGISELGAELLMRRLGGGGFSGDSYDALQDIFLTGGQAMFENFEERLYNEFKALLPDGSPLKVRRANDPLLDAWRGMAMWAQSGDSEKGYVTKAEYDEMGPDYMKEHNLGNVVC